MKYFNSYDNIYESEAWYFWGNMKAFWEHLVGDWH